MPVTAQDLATAVAISLSTVSEIDPNLEIQQPAPVDVGVQTVESKISIQSVSAPADVTYTQVATSDEVTNESLNRTAETLAADINAKLGTFATAISAALNDAGGDLSQQVTEINRVIGNFRSDVNTALAEIRAKEIEQTSDITTAVNARLATLVTNLTSLKTGVESVDAKIQALNDVYQTDAEAAAKVQSVNDFIASLREADLDIVGAIDGTIDEVNSMTRVQRKEFVISAGTGERLVDNVLDGFGEFTAAADYIVDAQVVGNYQVSVSVENKTAAGFKLVAKSNGVHFRPQPWDGSVTPVTVVVTVTHAKRDPLTFNVDTLAGSFVTNGNGTDANTVGAGN